MDHSGTSEAWHWLWLLYTPSSAVFWPFYAHTSWPFSELSLHTFGHSSWPVIQVDMLQVDRHQEAWNLEAWSLGALRLVAWHPEERTLGQGLVAWSQGVVLGF